MWGAAVSWTSDIQNIQDQAGGLLELHIIRDSDVTDLLLRSIMGDAEASRLVSTNLSARKQVATAPRKRPMLCACCPRPLLRHTPFAVIVATPNWEDFAKCLTLGVCQKCAVELDDIHARAMEALKRIWPDARPIDITSPHAAGHA